MITESLLHKFVLLTLLIALVSGSVVLGSARAISLGKPGTEDLASLVRLISASDDRLVFEFSTEQFSVEQDSILSPEAGKSNICQKLSLPGYASSDVAGAPQLPVTGALLGIPKDAQVELVVLESEIVSLPGVHDLCPVPQPQVSGASPLEQNAQPGVLEFAGYTNLRDAQIYAQDYFSPQQPAELVMTGFMRSQRVAQVRFHPFQYNPVSGQLHQVRYIRVALLLHRNLPITDSSRIIDEGPFESILRSSLLNYDQARSWRSNPENQASRSVTEESVDMLRIKILVDQDGIYQINYADLASLGVDVDSIFAKGFRMFNHGNEIAIYVAGEADFSFDPEDYILFYGQAVDTKYTETNVYYLQVGPGFGTRMALKTASPNGAIIPAYFTITRRFEENLLYLSNYASGPQMDTWYWNYVYAIGAPASTTLTITLDTLESTAPISATLRGLLKGYAATPQHHTRLSINGYLVDDAFWPAQAEYAFEVEIPQSYLVEGVNEITLECPLDNGISLDVPLINYIELDYAARFVAVSDRLKFTGENLGQSEFRVSNFSDPVLEVYDVTYPDNVSRLTGFAVQADILVNPNTPNGESIASAYTMIMGRNFQVPPRQYYVQTIDQRLNPQKILLDTASDLHNPANGADYIIITHPDFISSLEPLANHRISQGMRVKVVDIFDVYDEFNFGLVDPQAIGDFLAYSYANWSPPAPLYVLIVGDGTYDSRNYLGYGDPIYIPPYMIPEVDPYMGETVADNRLAMVAGADLLPDMALGRIPARTSAEVNLVVDKILSYENATPDLNWNREILFVADNQDYAGDFDGLSEVIVNLLPSEYTAKKVYMGINYTDRVLARQAVRNEINSGVLIVNYIGHSGVNFWGGEYYLDSYGVSLLNNANMLAFFVPMTCLEGSYQLPTYTVGESKSLADNYLFRSGGGAIGSWSPTGLGIATGHDFLNRGMYKAFFDDGIREVGLAALQGDMFLLANSGGSYLDLLSTYLIFGDPALKLRISQPLFLPFISLIP